MYADGSTFTILNVLGTMLSESSIILFSVVFNSFLLRLETEPGMFWAYKNCSIIRVSRSEYIFLGFKIMISVITN